MTDAAERKSYAEQTNMQGFDQIVALTENNINNSFEFRYAAEPKNGPLKKFHVEIEDEGTMDVDMDAPTVHFIRESFQALGDPPRIYFHLHLRSGQFTYWTGRGKNSVEHTFGIKGWTLSFAVDLSVEKLTKIPEEIQKKIEKLESYSVSQLLFNFTSPQISDFDPIYSDTPGLNRTDGEQIKEKMRLAAFLTEYLMVMKKEKKNTIGYSVTVETPKANSVTRFPPTSVKFQTMGHHIGGGPTAEARSGKNLFLFLQMVERRPMLTSPLTFSGNWVAGEANGTMAISKEFMWDHYLFPKLASVNLQALHTLNKVLHWAKSGLDNVDVMKASYDWLLAKEKPSDVDSKWTKYVTKGADFEWKGFGVLDEGTRIHTMESHVETSVRWMTGSNIITVTGKSRVEEQSGLKGGQGSVEITRPVLEWGVDLIFNSVKDGILEVVVREKQGMPKCTCEVADHYGLFSMIFGESKRNELSEKVKQVIQKEMEKERLAETIAALVNGQNNFVFPGGATLFLRDPIFNERGDLLVGLSLKS